MLSVNIPVFNVEVNYLVRKLAEQANALNIDYEIRIYDDGSADDIKVKNRELESIPNIVYRELEQNTGRAVIRNKMGLDSKKNYLLFIDADSKLISEKYIKKYLKAASPGCVICGGTAYDQVKPVDQKKSLRWVYGRRREAISAKERISKKGFIITSNNFLIDRKVFEKIHFRENLGPYGHEDTLLGYDLFSAGIKPYHIDNPVEHTGLEDSMIFLDKTKEALNNLQFIYEDILVSAPDFKNKVCFIKQYRQITSVVNPSLLRLFFNCFHCVIEKNLTGGRPSLFFYDIYRLTYFAKLMGEG